MGDFIQGSDILKKLGFDEHNQWVIYDESYQAFFNWFSVNITNENTLTELEILEANELKKDNLFLENFDLNEKLMHLSEEYPKILMYTDDDVLNSKIELQDVREINEMYSNLGQKIEKTRFSLNRVLHNMESEIQELENKEDILQTQCWQKARDLQELQKENKKLCIELNDCISKVNSPPLFTHQFPMEQYFLKCDSFMQYFSLYLQENFKFQDFFSPEFAEPHTEEIYSFEKLKTQIFYYNEKYILAKTKLMGLKRMIEEQDASKIHIMNLSNLKKETRELKILNGPSFHLTYETLVSDLRLHLQQIVEQQIEFVLYQNTKRKIERARYRLNNINLLSKIISSVLKNSELIWILMQLDAEKLKNRIDNSSILLIESQRCCKRIDLMKQIQILPSFNISEIFIGKLSKILTVNLGYKNLNTKKTIMNSFEKFNRSLEQSLINLTSNSCYNHILNICKDLKLIENTLSKYVFDGPTKRPILQNVMFLTSILKLKMSQEKLEKSLRKLRSEFHENISSRMNSDKLWRNSQLLWIWFLTEPKKVILALEEIRRAAQNAPNSTGIKTLVGIKRQKD